MRVAIVENTRVTHHGQVGVALHEAAAVIDLYKPWAGQALPARADADALVVFGGEQAATDDHTHPYLPHLAGLMRAYGAADRPVLGICLGAQLMARAYDADNLLGQTPEFGWVEVALTEAGQADPVFGTLPRNFPIFQWHTDTFSLPASAVHLAQNAAAASQAFRIGRASYATQFHFEASRAVAADWYRRFPEKSEEMSPGWGKALPEASERLGASADQHGLTIARNWVGLI